MNPYSMIYFFRTQALIPNTSFKINIVDNKKIVPLNFNIDSNELVIFKNTSSNQSIKSITHYHIFIQDK